MITWFDFSLLEWFAVLTTLLYNYLLTREKISCWIFGILSSAAGCVLFADKELWGQLVLYVFYMGMGIYGWWYWYSGVNHQRPVKLWPRTLQLRVLLVGIIISAGIYVASVIANAIALQALDIFITVFSLIATYKESRKILSGWIYWMILNGLSVWLYADADLKGLVFLSVIYFFLSIAGFYQWRKSYRTNTQDTIGM